MRPSIGVVAAAFMLAFTSQIYAKDEGIKACVEGLRIAAKNEYHIDSDEQLDSMFSDAFCEAVKDKRESKTNTNVAGAYGVISGSLSNDQAQLADYDRTYCRTTADKIKLKTAYRLQASIVTGDPLTKFNACMKIVVQAQAAQKRGVYGLAERTDSCRWSVKLSYVPTGKGNPTTARVETVHPYNVSCSKSPPLLDASEKKMECRRTSWGMGSLSFGTTQESLELEFEPEQQPTAPTPPAIPKADSLTKSFNVRRGHYDRTTTCIQDGRLCSGQLNLEIPGAQITNVVYACTGGLNENGHGYCGWSWGNQGAPDYATQYGASWINLGGGVAQWTRYWSGSAVEAISETYTVSYMAPHVDTPEELAMRAAYRDATDKYNLALANGPCPASAAPTKKKVAAK